MDGFGCFRGVGIVFFLEKEAISYYTFPSDSFPVSLIME
jgi:hypothetical protein